MTAYTEDELKKLPEFTSLDEALRNPESAQRLYLDRQENAAALVRVEELKNLVSLSISLSDVSLLLPRLGELLNLQGLYLQACNIPEFPSCILKLLHLRSLTIGNSRLENVPEEIGNLANLEELGLSQNALQELPVSIGKLAKLKRLYLCYNEIQRVPDSLCELTELRVLSLGVNRLCEVPEAIGHLRNLSNLSLNHNQLRGLPESICDLRDLQYLSLEHNPLETAPSCLEHMTWIKNFVIESEKRSLFMDWTYKPSQQRERDSVAGLNLFVTKGSSFYQPLMDALREARLDRYNEAILQATRNAIQIETTTPEDYYRLGSSRFGGFPDLMGLDLFPKTDGKYWCFLAQLNLADLAGLNSYLPRSGVLSFFIDSTEERTASVIFSPDEPQSLVTVRHAGGAAMVDETDDYTSTAHKLKFHSFASVPQDAPMKGLDAKELEAYQELSEPDSGLDHQLNGWPLCQLESPQDKAANSMRGTPSDWVPLLQLGYDHKVGFCFWDAGTLTFCIHQEDLRRWDFSRVHVSLETS